MNFTRVNKITRSIKLMIFKFLLVFSVSLKNFSPLPVKGFKIWPSLGTHGHWAVRVLLRDTPFTCLWSLRTCCRSLGSGTVTTCLKNLGLDRKLLHASQNSTSEPLQWYFNLMTTYMHKSYFIMKMMKMLFWWRHWFSEHIGIVHWCNDVCRHCGIFHDSPHCRYIHL